MLHKKNFVILLTGFVVVMISCKDNISSEEKPMAKVNDYVITEKGFRQELSASAYFHDIVGLTLENKKDFLNELIRKEILIQEAVSKGFDKEETFRQTIENYWEKTLITALLKCECSSLEKDIIVTRDEIETRYRHMSQSNPNLPSIEEHITGLEKEIREEKKTMALEGWVKDLWKEAEITIYEENLKSMR